MSKIEELTKTMIYNYNVLESLGEKGKLTEQEFDDQVMTVIVNYHMQFLDIGIQACYDDDPKFARIILERICRATEKRLEYFEKRYGHENRFEVEDK